MLGHVPVGSNEDRIPQRGTIVRRNMVARTLRAKQCWIDQIAVPPRAPGGVTSGQPKEHEPARPECTTTCARLALASTDQERHVPSSFPACSLEPAWVLQRPGSEIGRWLVWGATLLHVRALRGSLWR